ncbi:LuxR C-terminal-related transcriptional regulator [Streptomyces sp. NPDC091279]|uniref:helix-turn-helix transcriptional regulator n=1 Tax=unclassified Streptomyces TaxID=2593676 RepID=UPI0038142626
MFEYLGLTPAQERVYQAVLNAPDLSADQLADQLALTVEEVMTAFDALLALRILRRSHEDPGRVFAVDPMVGLRELLEREQSQLLESQRKIAASQTMVLRMLGDRGARAEANPGDGVRQLVGVDEIQRRLERLSQDVLHSVMTFMPGGAQSGAALAAARHNDKRALDHGVAMRTIGLDSIRRDEETLSYARWLTDAGGEFRTMRELPPRMVIVDKRMALVPMDPTDTRKGALFITEAGLVASLVALFEQVWEVSTPLGADRHLDAESLSPQEKRLLLLIAQGCTDEYAAGKLFISARTARRLMASIMERLGARSRFEAGVKAAQRGWL